MRFFMYPSKLMWLLGLVLMVGTVAGAGWMLNTGAPDETATQNSRVSVPFDGKFIVSLAYVDVEGGVAKLYPVKLGRVVSLVRESDTVFKKGELLLQVDDTLAKGDLHKAKLALQMAEKKLAKARRLKTKHDLEVKALQFAIDALEHEKKAAQQTLAKAQHLFDEGLAKNKFDLDAAKHIVEKLDAIIKGKQSEKKLLEAFPPDREIELAELNVKLKKQDVADAEEVVELHKVRAPFDGTVLRVYTSKGEVLGSNPKVPAIEFCPTGPRIIRAEVLQEWADRLKVGQEAIIEDDTTSSYQWKGKVKRISDWFTHRRSIIQEPFQFNDVRTLECIIEVYDAPQGKTLRIGQRMRVMIEQGGP